MAAVKVQVVKRKAVGDLDAQSPIKNRLTIVVWATIVILLLVALSLLVYFVSVMSGPCERRVSHRGDIQLSPTVPICSGIIGVPKNASKYVKYPYPSTPNRKGNRCAFVIFSDTKEVRISFANYSFQPFSNPEFIVAELSDEGGDKLKYSKLEYSRGLVAKVPSVIYYTSDGDEKQSTFVIEISPIESSGSSTGFTSAAMLGYTKTGAMKRQYPRSASYPMLYLAVFEAPSTSQPGRHFTCSPLNSTCCNAISLYRLPTIKLGDTASRLTGLSTTSGVKVDSEVTVAMMFGLPSNFDASAGGSWCLFEWHAVSQTTMEVETGH